jgi:hypothetical protein
MTEHDINVAGQLGEMRADMRTVKHDVANLSGKMDGLSAQIAAINTKQERSLGFFAGVGFIIVSVGGLLIGFAKLIFGQH